MLLLIDAGNTRVKWALAAGLPLPSAVDASAVGPAAWLAHGMVTHDAIDTLGVRWQAQPVSRVLVSNVAGAAIRAALLLQLHLLRTADGAQPVVVWFAAAAATGGVRNSYREPTRLGCDRLAALIGARVLRPGQALVVATCGTATTVDALAADGTFTGGMILPGLGTMAAALALRTAQLPSIATPVPVLPAAGFHALFADNTEDAIRNGCLAAQAGAIERAVAAHGGAHCLLSGGAAGWVAPYLQVAVTQVDNLVLTGLHVVAILDGNLFESSAGSGDLPAQCATPDVA